MLEGQERLPRTEILTVSRVRSVRGCGMFKQSMSSRRKSCDLGWAGGGGEGNVMIAGENGRRPMGTKHQGQ